MKNWRWENFAPAEVLSPHGLKLLRRNNLKLQGFALDGLQNFRTFIQAPISVNHGHLKYRGYRSTAENAWLPGSTKKKPIRGAPDSTHVQGIAFDQNCYSTTLPNFYVTAVRYSLEQARKSGGNPSHKGFRAIGVYPNKNFIHTDFRSFPRQKEDYVFLFNGEMKGYGFPLYEKDMPKTLPALLQLLKRELRLPGHWSL